MTDWQFRLILEEFGLSAVQRAMVVAVRNHPQGGERKAVEIARKVVKTNSILERMRQGAS